MKIDSVVKWVERVASPLNKALHLTAILLRYIAAGKLGEIYGYHFLSW